MAKAKKNAVKNTRQSTKRSPADKQTVTKKTATKKRTNQSSGGGTTSHEESDPKPIKFRIRPVTASNWNDLEKLFEGKGGPKYCWCMVWRNMIEGKSRSSASDKKASLKKYVNDRLPVGLLAYDAKEIAGWCSVAPRDSYRELGGLPKPEKVWSLVCFYIRPPYRKRGLTNQFIEVAAKYAKKRGARFLEAYPVDPSSPSYRFGGFLKTFKDAGFKKGPKAGSRRHVMTIGL